MVRFERVAGSVLKVGDGFVEVRLGLEFPAPSGQQFCLSLQDQKDGSGAGVELSLLAFILQFGG